MPVSLDRGLEQSANLLGPRVSGGVMLADVCVGLKACLCSCIYVSNQTTCVCQMSLQKNPIFMSVHTYVQVCTCLLSLRKEK